MFDQLESIVGRYEELGELLSDPEVVSDTKRFMEFETSQSEKGWYVENFVTNDTIRTGMYVD